MTTVAAGTILIVDDGTKTSTPAVFLSPIDGSILSHIDNFYFGEDGFVQLDGHICVSDANNFGVAFLDKTLNLIKSVTFANIPTGITGDRSSYFYVLVSIGGNLTLHKYDNQGNSITTYAMPTNSVLDPIPCCISRDNTTFYYASNSTTINKITLSILSNTTFVLANGISSLEIDSSDNIYATSTVGGIPKLIKYSNTFTSLGSVTVGPAGYSIDVGALDETDTHEWVWTQKTSTTQSSFFKIKLSDLSIVTQIIGVLTDRISSPIISISPSCPLLITAGLGGETFDECGGGSLANGSNSGGDPGCVSCSPASGGLPPSLPSFFSGFLVSAGATTCWDIGIINAIIPNMEANVPPFFPQLNSAGQARGRFYKDSPTNYDMYVDTNKGCLWAWIPHGF